MPQSILQHLTLRFHRDYFSVLWYQKCVLFIDIIGMSVSPSAFLDPPEKLLNNLYVWYCQMSLSLEPPKWPSRESDQMAQDLQFSLPHISSTSPGHWYHKMVYESPPFPTLNSSCSTTGDISIIEIYLHDLRQSY